jgi:formate dehydrogenase iron-sulfur subunit
MTKVFVPLDSAALSMGANEVAQAISDQAAKAGLDVTVVRNGSRGMLWLEPLVEVETEAGRVGYANVSADQIPELIAVGFLSGSSHDSCLGIVEELDFLKDQTRITFARVGVIDPLSLG